MFFRTKTVKGTALVQLVESFRNAEGQPRQRVVASLGDASVPEAEKHRIARVVENHLSGNGDLLGPDLSEEAAAWVTRILQLLGRSKSARPVVAAKVDGVLIDRIATENVVELGPQLVALAAWNELGLSDALDQAGLNASQIATAQLLVANRLIEPLSEWALIDWSARTALPELLGLRVTKSTKDRLYHTSDALYAHRKTLALMLDRLEMPGDGLKPVVILDAGFASADNIVLLKERCLSYLINITRGSRAKYAASFAEGGFEPVPGRSAQELVEVKTIVDPDDEQGRLVLCRSAQRREKENAMLSKAEARFLKDVETLRERITQGRLKDPATIERKIGRLQKKHPRVVRFYALAHENGTLNATRHEDKRQQAGELCGDYVLKTDQRLSASQTWSLYMTLLQAEEGFASLKGTLGLRPNFHQLEHRVEGHIFISVLAYHLLTWVRESLRDSGDLRDWKTLRRLLSTHSLATTSLPLEDGRVLHIRKPSLPDPEQALLYKRLRIDWKSAFPQIKTFAKP